MCKDTKEKLKEIKGRFRLMMNGVASRSMRDKGMGYKINWGVELPVLKNLAEEYGKDYDLANALWDEDIRECKILATLIMPVEKMTEEDVRLWAGSLPNLEMAEMAAFNLFRHLSEAKKYALSWISSCNDLEVICGYNVLSRLFLAGKEFDIHETDKFIEQAQAAVASSNFSVRHAAVNALSRFAGIDEEHGKIVECVFKTCNFDFF